MSENITNHTVCDSTVGGFESPLRFAPCVFMVGTDYQIIFLTSTKGIGRVEIAEQVFCREEGGLPYHGNVHKITVPGELLNRTGCYTVTFTEYANRKPYYPEGVEKVRKTYDFVPYTGGGFRLFQFADTHNQVDSPLDAYRLAGPCDIILFNGDINSSSNEIAFFDTSFRLAEQAVGGTRPMLYSRGNHDTRGLHAQDLLDYIPTRCDNGRRETFYTFRQGDLWGLVMDCGEDKADSCPEYGGTASFEAFRRRETAYLEQLIAHKESEYAAEGVRYRIAICHIPFTETFQPPFNIELDTYTHWAKLLNTMGVDCMISGHVHKAYILPANAPNKHEAAFPTAILGIPKQEAPDGGTYYVGGLMTAADGAIRFRAVPEQGNEL